MAKIAGHPEEVLRRGAWTSYWAEGPLHSCIGTFDERYTGAIGTFWDGALADAGPGQRLLDLGTGNGALPKRLRALCAGDDGLRIDAVDLAEVAPPWHEASRDPGIVFRSGIPMEALPYADGTFDWVVSQFGIEYSRWPEALVECCRVARPTGRLAFVLHHADSVLVSVGRVELAHQVLLQAPGGLLAAAARALPFIARARSGHTSLKTDVAAGQARNGYNAAMQTVSEAIARSQVPDLLVEARSWIHALVAQATDQDVGKRLAALEAYSLALESAGLRTRELVGHARTRDHMDEMVAVLAAHLPGHRMALQPLSQTEGILGWGLTAFPEGLSN